MAYGNYEIDLVLRREGAILERQGVSLAPAAEDAHLMAVLRGEIANDGSVPDIGVTPLWHETLGEPAVEAFELTVGDAAPRRYDTGMFSQAATLRTRRRLARGVIDGEKKAASSAGETAIVGEKGTMAADDASATEPVTWSIEAVPRKRRRLGRARVTRAPFPLSAGDLPGAETGVMGVRVAEGVLDTLEELIRATPLEEIAGLLTGRLIHDQERGLCEVRLEQYTSLPAGDAGTSGAHFDFGPETFRTGRRALDDADADVACMGWAHTHPACAGCRDQPECPTQTVFFSEDDLCVQATSFAAPYQLALVAGKLVNTPVTDPGFMIFGWRDGAVSAVPFRIDGLDADETAPRTSALIGRGASEAARQTPPAISYESNTSAAPAPQENES